MRAMPGCDHGRPFPMYHEQDADLELRNGAAVSAWLYRGSDWRNGYDRAACFCRRVLLVGALRSLFWDFGLAQRRCCYWIVQIYGRIVRRLSQLFRVVFPR
jgi:hypothetical protein